MNATKEIRVTQSVCVTVDVEAFTEAFLAEFRESLYPFQDVADHMDHLAQLYARGLVNEFTDFIEGYGNPADFGIKFEHKWTEVEAEGE